MVPGQCLLRTRRLVIQRYVILEQDSIAATVFSRLGSDWIARADVLQMPEIGIEISLAEIYADLPMPGPENEGSSELASADANDAQL